MADLIIITGVPATGKTSLSIALQKKLGYPILSKDIFKESLFDSLGYSDREQSRRYGVAAMELLYLQMNSLLSSGTSCIVEANFRPDKCTKIFEETIRVTNCNIIQVLCKTEPEVALHRFTTRPRHPGHCDIESLEEFRNVIYAGLPPLPCGLLFEFDTTFITDELMQDMVEKIVDSLKKTV